MKIPLHVQLRRKTNDVLNKLLSSFNTTKETTEFINKEEVQSIMDDILAMKGKI